MQNTHLFFTGWEKLLSLTPPQNLVTAHFVLYPCMNYLNFVTMDVYCLLLSY